MATTVGLIGRPGSGAKTIYELVTGRAPEDVYLKPGVKAQVATVHVPDDRVIALERVFKPKKTTYAQFEIMYLPGFSASDDRKLVSAALSNYRTCQALALVVNMFSDEGRAVADKETRNLIDELILIDLVQIESMLPVMKKRAAGKEPLAAEKLLILERLLTVLEAGKPLRFSEMSESELALIKEYSLVTMQPILITGNVSDDQIGDNCKLSEKFESIASDYGAGFVHLSALIERELQKIENSDERNEFMKELGVSEPGLQKFIQACYKLLGLQTFLTGGDKEVRAWTIRNGDTAVDAAAAIHTDLAKGFVRAEVYKLDDVIEQGGYQKLRGTDKMKLVGKEYPMKDGDYIIIRSSV
jgi:ribosome-binding ATPase